MARTVQEQLAAGASRKPEAQAGWQALAEYAMNYLGHVEGLLALVERISKFVLA